MEHLNFFSEHKELTHTRKETLNAIVALLRFYHERWIIYYNQEIIILETTLQAIDWYCRHLLNFPIPQEECNLLTCLAYNVMSHLAMHIFSTVRVIWNTLVPKAIPVSYFTSPSCECSILHICTPLTPLDLVELFILKGVDVDSLDSVGITPLLRFLNKRFLFQYTKAAHRKKFILLSFVNYLYCQDKIECKQLIDQEQKIFYPSTVDVLDNFKHKVSNVKNRKHEAYNKDIDYRMVADTYYFCKLLIQYKANLNFFKESRNSFDVLRFSVLCCAIAHCDLNTVKLLMDNGANQYFLSRINLKCEKDKVIYFDCTMLLQACLQKRSDLLNLFDNDDYSQFTEKKGILNIINPNNTIESWTKLHLYDFLHIVFHEFDVMYFKKLLKHRCLWSLTLFFTACRALNYPFVYEILQEDRDLAKRPLFINKKLTTVASEICEIPIEQVRSKYKDFIAIVKLLIEYGADFTSTTCVHGQVVHPVDYIVNVMDKGMGSACSLFLRLNTEKPLNKDKQKSPSSKLRRSLSVDDENRKPKTLKQLALGYLQKQFETQKPTVQQIEQVNYFFENCK